MLNFNNLIRRSNRWVKTFILSFLLVFLFLGINPADAALFGRNGGLPSGNAITDGKALLRYSLPIDNQSIREIQINLEDIYNELRGKRWNNISQKISQTEKILSFHASDLIASVPDSKKPEAELLFQKLQTGIANIRDAVKSKDKQATTLQRSQLLEIVGQLEEAMVAQFPFQSPPEYRHLPYLKGRATVEMTTDKGNITLIVDGYSAPITAGNFVDLVQRGFYNGLEFTRAEDSYVLQAGDPPGPDNGFIDPTTGKYRAIPLEVLVKGDSAPFYGITLEDAGRYRDEPVLPFSAYGTVAMARPETDANGASSQFFFFLFEAELTPAGRNLLDGRYAVFGYVVEGQEVLGQLKAGDKIKSAQVVQGAEYLSPPLSTTEPVS